MSRHLFLTAVLLLVSATSACAQSEYLVYVGSYGTAIQAYRFQPGSSEVTAIGAAGETPRPSFLAVHPNHRFLYAVNEVNEFDGEQAGSVSAFAIDRQSGRLTAVNTVSTRGTGPCHLAVDATGKCLVVANYGGGSVAAFPIRDDGSLGEASAFIQHTGSSVDPRRQQAPHAHEAAISPDNRFVLVPDLGLDKVMVYRLDAANAALTAGDPQYAVLAPGSGPRHLAFHPNGRLLYVINELASTVTAFRYEADGARMTEFETVSTLPEGFDGESSTAEIGVHPNGRFLYGSNRGHDSIAVFSIDAETGALAAAGHVPTQGRTPRAFAIDPTGRYMFVGNQATDNLVVFRIDEQNGGLTATGTAVGTPSPVSVVFVPRQ